MYVVNVSECIPDMYTLECLPDMYTEGAHAHPEHQVRFYYYHSFAAGFTPSSSCATMSAMARDEVRPGDSMPNRLTRPGTPCAAGPCSHQRNSFAWFGFWEVMSLLIPEHGCNATSAIQQLQKVQGAPQASSLAHQRTWTTKSMGHWPGPANLGRMPAYATASCPSWSSGQYLRMAAVMQDISSHHQSTSICRLSIAADGASCVLW